MNQTRFRLLVLVFLFALLRCSDQLYVVEHWHWRVSVSATQRNWVVSPERLCEDAPGESIKLTEVHRSKRNYCTYRDPQYVLRRTDVREGLDRPVAWPYVPLEPGEVKLARGQCWVRFRLAPEPSTEVRILPVECEHLVNYPLHSVWQGSDSVEEIGNMRLVQR